MTDSKTAQPMLADHLDRATACVESGAWPGGVFVMRDDGLRDGLRCVENGLSPVDVERALSAPLAVSYVAGNVVSSIKRLVGRPRVALPASSDLFVHRWSILGSARAEQRIVVFGPVLKPDAATLNALRSAGFDRCWLHGPACQPPRGDGCRCQPHILSDEEEARLARLHRRQQKRHTWVWTGNPTRRSPP